jgi:phage terminase large subunit-like protein
MMGIIGMSSQPVNDLQDELLALLEAQAEAIKYNKLDTLFPDTGKYRRDAYPKHIAFLNASSQYSQLAFIAANRCGKTLTACTAVAYHLTGNYPDWYKGRRFLNPISAWAAGISNQSTKEVIQDTLIGDMSDVGTGTIPKDSIVKITKKPGVADAIETVSVRHKSGGISRLTFKAYEQGWESFQGTYKQLILLDEEPKDFKIYTECLTRTMNDIDPGIILCTFTPLLGRSELVKSFLPDGVFPRGGVSHQNPEKFVINVGWEDVPHLSEKQKAEILKSYAPHERAARSKGIPSLGAGAVYPYSEDNMLVDPFPIPDWWPRAYGLDPGWSITACVWGALDPDTGIVYLYSEHYQGESNPIIHATAVKSRGDWIPGACDPAGRNGSDGERIFTLYQDAGLYIQKANKSVEAGIWQCGQMMETGQLKVFNTLYNWINEFRSYARDEKTNKVVKKNDHAMDAMRYLLIDGFDWWDTPPQDGWKNNDFSSYDGRNKITGY